jgi:hypothetical protein
LLAVEQGPAFGARAAVSTTVGLVSTMAFCLAYTWSAQRLDWRGSLVVGYSAYLAFTLILGHLATGALAASGLAVAAMALTLLAMPRAGGELVAATPPWWDLPLRAVFTGSLVLAVTTAADLLGPRWTGLLTPFPIATSVLAVFAHAQSGSPVRLLRGLVLGLFGFVVFTTIVATTVESWGVVPAFGAGVAAAVTWNALLAWVLTAASPTRTNPPAR